MIFEFTTEGQTYRINPDPAKLTGAELIAVERNTGMGMVEFAQALQNPSGSAAAISSMVWLARRRSGDFVKWADFAENFHPLTLGVEIIGTLPGDTTADEPPAVSDEKAQEPPAEPKPRAAAKPRASRTRSRAKAV